MTTPTLKTFENATPETDEVVLCDACGATLHSEEDDVLWEDNASHYCERMKDATIAHLTAELVAMRVELAETRRDRDRQQATTFQWKADARNAQIQMVVAWQVSDRAEAERDAMIAAAYEAAADEVGDWDKERGEVLDMIRESIRALTPADTRTAYNAAIRAAWEAGRDAAASAAWEASPLKMVHLDAIGALKPPTTITKENCRE